MEVNRISVKGLVGSCEVRNPGMPNAHYRMSVCVSEEIRRDKMGRPVYEKDWFNIVAFDGLLKKMEASGVKKGDFVEVIGKMKRSEWGEGRNKSVSYNIIAREFGVLRRKKEIA